MHWIRHGGDGETITAICYFSAIGYFASQFLTTLYYFVNNLIAGAGGMLFAFSTYSFNKNWIC